jgi:hypothetical protein
VSWDGHLSIPLHCIHSRDPHVNQEIVIESVVLRKLLVCVGLKRSFPLSGGRVQTKRGITIRGRQLDFARATYACRSSTVRTGVDDQRIANLPSPDPVSCSRVPASQSRTAGSEKYSPAQKQKKFGSHLHISLTKSQQQPKQTGQPKSLLPFTR